MIQINGYTKNSFNVENPDIGDIEFLNDDRVANFYPKLPIKVWGTKEAVMADAAQGEHSSAMQAMHLAEHPLARMFVALMPDFHYGYGMPIGGVAAMKGGVIPNAVGNDIGCGMMAVRTDIEAASLSKEKLAAIRLEIHATIPVGNSVRQQPASDKFYDDTEAHVFGSAHGRGADCPVIEQNWERTKLQLGTLGGGNHFIEFQVDHETGLIWIMLHSGSRGVGEKIKTFYDKEAKRLNEMWYSQGCTKELAFFPLGTPEYDAYLREMQWAMTWAERNRHHMLLNIFTAFYNGTGRDHPIVADEVIETHHNYAAMENHFGENVLIHRKGAVKAVGQVIIPGSMGTASYICEGLNNPMSFGSCSHGAGRPRSRADTNKMYTLEKAKAEMAHVVYGVKEGQFDELPGAYKDVHEVIAQQADLVTPVHVLHPLMVVKG